MRNFLLFAFLCFYLPLVLGQTMLKDINLSDKASAYNGYIHLAKDKVLFGLENPDFGVEPWITDGTIIGSYMIKDIHNGPKKSNPQFVYYSETLKKSFFIIENGTQTVEKWAELWCSDFTETGTIFLTTIDGWATNGEPLPISEIQGIVYLVGQRGKLWRTDGTENGSYLLKDFAITPFSNNIVNIHLLPFQNKLYINISDAKYPFHYWVSDGTSSGTEKLNYLSQAIQCPARINAFHIWKNKLYFIGSPIAAPNWSLLVCEGASTEVEKVKELGALALDSSGYTCNIIGGTDTALYFSYKGSNANISIFKTNGTQIGTNELAKKEVTGKAIIVNNTFLFEKSDSIHGSEIWKDLGTNTALLKDIWPGIGTPFNMGIDFTAQVIGNKAFFIADDGTHGREIWQTDGTATGTRLLKDLNIIPGINLGNLFFTLFNNEIYFLNGSKLYVTDGTEMGTQLINTYPVQNFSPQVLGVNDLGLILLVYEGNNYLSIYKVSGNHFSQKLFNPPIFSNNSSSPTYFFKISDKEVLFMADDDIHGRSFWKTDGTEEGTTYIVDVPAKQNSPYNIVPFQNKIYYSYSALISPDFHYYLWESDGTIEGSKVIFEPENHLSISIVPKSTKDFLFLIISKPSNPTLLAAYNGKNIQVLDTFPNINGILVGDSKAYFWINVNNQYEIWESDGTHSGTKKRLDLPLYAYYYSNPQLIGDNLFFEVGLQFANNHSLLQISTNTFQTQKIDLDSALTLVPPKLYQLGSKIMGCAYNTVELLDIHTNKLELIYQMPTDRGIHNSSVAIGDSVFYFIASDTLYHTYLYRTNGTDKGTYLVSNLSTITKNTPTGSIPSVKLRVIDNIIYFGNETTENGVEWWRSDGTKEGTFLLKDICEGINSGFSFDSHNIMEKVNNSLIFTAADRYHGYELWKMPIETKHPSVQTIQSFLIFPNPGQEQIHIQFATKGEKKELIIGNVLGQIVYEGETTADFMDLQVPQLANGVYYLSVSSTNKIETQPLIIAH